MSAYMLKQGQVFHLRSLGHSFATFILTLVGIFFWENSLSYAIALAGKDDEQRSIQIDAASNNGLMRPRHGFFGTINNASEPHIPNPALVTALKPAIWRVLRYPTFKESSRLAKEISVDTQWWYMAAIKDQYVTKCQHSTAYDGTWPPVCIQPQLNPDYVAYLEEYYDRYKKEAENKEKEVDYWSFWHELDAYGRFVPWDKNKDAFQAFKIMHDTLRKKDPNAKIIGPSFFPEYKNDPMFLEFIDFVAANKLTLDGFGWTRYGKNPEKLPETLEVLRTLMKAKGLCSVQCPPIHLYEYGGPEHSTIPGWAAGWLYYIEKSDAKFAVRSDWYPVGNLIGELVNGNPMTPRPVYWVHRAYALMDQGTLLTTKIPNTNTVALATLHKETQSMLILAGSFFAEEQETKQKHQAIQFLVENYPFARGGKVSVVQYRLSGDISGLRKPALSPEFKEYLTPVSAEGTITVPVDNFQDGEAYVLFVRPAAEFGKPTSLLPPVPQLDSALDLALTLDSTVYELDEEFQGVVTIINNDTSPTVTTLKFDLIKNGVLVTSLSNPILIPPGTTTISLKTLGTGRINADPDLVGDWTMRYTLGTKTVEVNFVVIIPRPVTVTVDASNDIGPVRLMQGFLNGYSGNPPLELTQAIATLKPKFWRGHLYFYPTAKALGAKFTLALFEEIAIRLGVGDYRELRPWEDWSAYKRIVRSIAQEAKAQGQSIDYWDVWGEPDNPGYWQGTAAQLLELYKHTHDAIRAVDPEAKLVGPDLAYFSVHGTLTGRIIDLTVFLDYLRDNNLRYNALSWHEFNTPEDIQTHVEQARQLILERPSLGALEIHVPEYASAAHHLVPGWNVGWLAALESAGIQQTSRACWAYDYQGELVKDCWVGLEGLFLNDNTTPQPLYWLHQLYGEMDNTTRLSSVTTNPRSLVLASKNDGTKEIQLLVGRFSCGRAGKWCTGSESFLPETKGPPVNMDVKINNYPYSLPGSTVQSAIQRIPNEGIPGPLWQPIVLPLQILPVDASGTMVVSLPQYQDGDAYFITLTSDSKIPEPTSTPTPEPMASPIPTQTPSPTPPLAAWNIVADDGVRESGVKVCWSQPKKVVSKLTNVKQFQIYGSPVSNRLGKTLARVTNKKRSTACYTDTKAIAGVTYFYSVAALDKKKRKLAISARDSGWKNCKARDRSTACELRRRDRG